MVVCLNTFIIENFGYTYSFIMGEKYSFRIEFLDFICDEMITYQVNNIPITEHTLRENFILLEEWRDKQINRII